MAAADDLAAQLAASRRYLQWASFLVAMMAIILIIDLQLKKQVAKQAVQGGRRFHINKSTLIDYSSSIERGQSLLRRRDSDLSASSLPPVWHRAQ